MYIYIYLYRAIYRYRYRYKAVYNEQRKNKKRSAMFTHLLMEKRLWSILWTRQDPKASRTPSPGSGPSQEPGAGPFPPTGPTGAGAEPLPVAACPPLPPGGRTGPGRLGGREEGQSSCRETEQWAREGEERRAGVLMSRRHPAAFAARERCPWPCWRGAGDPTEAKGSFLRIGHKPFPSLIWGWFRFLLSFPFRRVYN